MKLAWWMQKTAQIRIFVFFNIKMNGAGSWLTIKSSSTKIGKFFNDTSVLRLLLGCLLANHTGLQHTQTYIPFTDKITAKTYQFFCHTVIAQELYVLIFGFLTLVYTKIILIFICKFANSVHVINTEHLQNLLNCT